MTDLVFVYGTLKEGHYNHCILGGSHCVGKATVEGMLYSVGSFPAMVEGEGIIHGEVYEVVSSKIMNTLDRLEGEGSMYHRRIVSALINTADSGRREEEVHTYIWGMSLDQLEIIPSGIWGIEIRL